MQRAIHAAGGLLFVFWVQSLAYADDSVTRPEVSDQASPVVKIEALTRDGSQAVAIMRKPPGKGPFPAVIIIHGTLRGRTVDYLKEVCLEGPTHTRFLAAGYVVVASTFRTYDHDPQSEWPILDTLAIVEHVRELPEVDPTSIVVYGCSGGGSLALEMASRLPLAAIAAEDPASVLFTGMFTKNTPKQRIGGFRGTDSMQMIENPERYYIPEIKKITQQKIRKISCPVLILNGGHSIKRMNDIIIVAELHAMEKTVEVIDYPGEPHCFGFRANDRPAPALKLFEDCHAFFRRYLTTTPRAVESKWVRKVPVKVPVGHLGF